MLSKSRIALKKRGWVALHKSLALLQNLKFCPPLLKECLCAEPKVSRPGNRGLCLLAPPKTTNEKDIQGNKKLVSNWILPHWLTLLPVYKMQTPPPHVLGCIGTLSHRPMKTSIERLCKLAANDKEQDELLAMEYRNQKSKVYKLSCVLHVISIAPVFLLVSDSSFFNLEGFTSLCPVLLLTMSK